MLPTRNAASPKATFFSYGAALLVAGAAQSAAAAESLVLIPDYRLFGLFGGDGGVGTLWIMVAAFAVLVFPLNTLIFQPILRALAARDEKIQGARDRSAQLEGEADEVLARYENAIREARSESESARQTQIASARDEQTSLTTAARADAEQELERARGELNQSLEEARATLRASADDLATAAAESILGRTLS